MSIAVPPGGRSAPGGETPPGGEGVPGGRGAPGGTTTPTAPLGRPPRITLRPLRKHGQQKTVQKVKITPDRGAQLRAALTPKQRQEQIHKHVQETMPQTQQKNQPGPGTHVPPQAAGMGQKGQAHKTETRAQHKAARQTTRTKVNTRHAEIQAQANAPQAEDIDARAERERAEYLAAGGYKADEQVAAMPARSSEDEERSQRLKESLRNQEDQAKITQAVIDAGERHRKEAEEALRKQRQGGTS